MNVKTIQRFEAFIKELFAKGISVALKAQNWLAKYLKKNQDEPLCSFKDILLQKSSPDLALSQHFSTWDFLCGADGL